MATKKKQLAKKKKKRKSKNTNKVMQNITQIVILAGVICIVAYCIYSVAKFVIKPSDALIIEKGTISETETVEGYIIREEKVIENQNSETELIEIKSEGEKTAKGEEIFRYKTANEEEVTKQIDELNEEIQKALEGKNYLFPSDVKALENQIDKTLGKTINQNDLQTIAENKKDILNYMKKKSKIAGDSNPANEYINGLIEQRTNLEKGLFNNSNYEKAPLGGVVSYRIDGLEEKLVPTEIENLTKEYLDSLNLKTGQMISKNTKTGKVVNSFACYIAVIRKVDEDTKNHVEIGDKVTLKITQDKIIKATVESVKQEEKTELIVFKITRRSRRFNKI